MVRNCLKMLMCLMLAVMLPLCALADVQHTLKVVPGDVLGTDSAVADLMNVLSLRLTQGAKSGALTIALADEDVATAALTADTTGVYVHSNLLSDDVLYVTWDDGFAYLTELIKAQLRAEGAPESDLSALDSSMAELKNSIVAAIGSGMTSMAAEAPPEMTAAALEQVFQDDPKLQEYAASMYEKFTVEKGSFTDAQRDAADEKYTLTMNVEDLLKLCDTEYMRSLMRDIAAMDGQLQGDALEKATDETLNQVRELYRNSGYEMVLHLYTHSGGTVLVGMDMGMSMTLSEEGESHSISMNTNYDRLTDENGISHKADMSMMMDGSSAVQMAFDLHRGVDEVSEGSAAMLVEGEEITIQYKAENTQPDVRQRSAALYVRSGATAIIPLAASDRPIVIFEVVTAPADPAVLAAVEQADAYSSVNVMKLSDEEMQALGTDIATRTMQALYSALAKLPTSTLKLAMQLMQ